MALSGVDASGFGPVFALPGMRVCCTEDGPAPFSETR